MQHLGSRWADLHAEAELLEESKKCVLASITLLFMNEGENKSASETRAFAAPEYVEHVRKMVEARRKANQAKVEFEGIKTHMNLTRTYEATRRAEMQML
jgi:lysophospholipase L1-like esterase